MTINSSGTFRRGGDAEQEDSERLVENYKAESWKSWPNEAGFIGLEEHRGPISLNVKGHIPSWAAGALYRTGPGQNVIENTSRGTHHVSHWFDGFAHTHKFDIIPPEDPEASATVTYSSRRQTPDLVEDIKKRGWRASISFAQRADPCVGIFSKMMATFRPAPSGANHNVVVERNVPGFPSGLAKDEAAGHRTGTNNLFMLTDAATIREIHPDTLEPMAINNPATLNPLLKGQMACAHAPRDPQTGDLFNFNLEMGRRPTYRIFRANASTGTVDILATLPAPELRAAYIHSMFLTENYVVLCVPSSHLGWNGAKVPYVNNIAEAIEPFDESRKTQWVVVDRRHGKGVVGRFTTPAGFFFHAVNAFEDEVPRDDGEGTDLNFDVIWYENTDIIKSFYLDVILDRGDAARKLWNQDGGSKTCPPRLNRWRFRLCPDPQTQPYRADSPSASGELVFSIPAPHAGELPTINPARATLPYRYVYGNGTRGLSTLIDCLVKTDLETRAATIWAAPTGHTPGEAIFVARPDAEAGAAEDDGVLLSVVLDGPAQRSYLLVLDARTMEEVGRAEAEFAVALGFHGLHAPAVKL
ncbi:Beta,beta-carotene 15,15'-monooxygenase-like protein [Hapsidospora chrysogenum ATCC 11550]|uniref:Beta,beta-carotene 15,15'-monooxygenase-like protein n=1 Tax=Hapsidospora chrysogenum (strain ATCC 11550 / CBS 779.69 / DSM 880 / IAM 14645 / JCM 23072 / IMI 49137) TaxID=857340 RepID=A0A086SVB4_HAPC1|nr:Beta,beta-carotene 15,15'-monooxygenase-like protein [Hapsidospora chrysogenum ATCC 11550]